MVNSQQPKRVTIMLDDDLDQKLRARQSRLIRETQGSYSFSKVLNEALRKVLIKKVPIK